MKYSFLEMMVLSFITGVTVSVAKEYRADLACRVEHNVADCERTRSAYTPVIPEATK